MAPSLRLLHALGARAASATRDARLAVRPWLHEGASVSLSVASRVWYVGTLIRVLYVWTLIRVANASSQGHSRSARSQTQCDQ
jgi:hypothetical protein